MEHSELDVCANRFKVKVLEAEMRKFPQIELETFHYYADNRNGERMYARVVPRLAGTTIVGKVHKREHFYIVSKGSVMVMQDDAPAKTYHAGDVVVSKPGTKRAVYAIEDSICMTVHRTSKTDLKEIEDELVEHDPLSLYGPGNILKALKCHL